MGYVKIPRDIEATPICDDPYIFRIYMHCLLNANHKDNKYKDIVIEKGSFITSYRAMSEKLKLDIKTIRKYLSQLEQMKYIVLSSDYKGTKIKVINYDSLAKFEVCEEIPHQSDKVCEEIPHQSDKVCEEIPHQSDKVCEEIPHQSDKVWEEVPRKVWDQVPTNNNDINKNIYSRAEHDTSSDEIKRIIDYLNKKANKNFKPGSRNTKRYITARLKEGYTFDDFKRVIDTKCSQWIGDPKMERYLRPETLFGNKFEGYLNEKGKAPAHKSEFRLPDA